MRETSSPQTYIHLDDISKCSKCPRLVKYLLSVVPRASYRDFPYWNKPVPDFGDILASLLIVGLAPGKDGASRTGYPFQGDKAGLLLYDALHLTGYSNKGNVTDFDLLLTLKDCLITNSVHCAPPENKPTKEEFAECLPYLINRLQMPTLRTVLCIGRDAFVQVSKALNFKDGTFTHGANYKVGGLRVRCSFHTSGYNQATKRITTDMLVKILREIKADHESRVGGLGQ